MRKIQQLGTKDFFEPLLKIPFSVSFAVTLIPLEQACPSFIPLMCIGGTWEAVNFESTGKKPNSHQIMRFGLCNRDLRPIIQIQTTRGLFEVVMNYVLPPDYYAFDLNFDNTRREIKLFVNGELAAMGSIEGQLDFEKHEQIYFGLGPRQPIWGCQVQRFLLSDEQTADLAVVVPNDLTNWNEYPLGYDRIYQIHEDRFIAYTYISKHFLHRKNRKLRTARGILDAAGKGEAHFENDNDYVVEAAKTITELTKELEALLKDQDTKEPELLQFFKDTPAAAFLLESDSVRQFREDEIQHYGRIDFVFELHDGAFRVTEIESPQSKIFLKKGEFSQPMNHAIHQVNAWIRGAKKSPQHFETRYQDQQPAAFLGLVVIGRSSQIDSPQKRELWGEIQSKFRCLTWDDILDRGNILARRLQDPMVTDLQWD